MSTNDLRQVRLDKATKLREQGHDPFPICANVFSIAAIKLRCADGLMEGDRYSAEKVEPLGHQFTTAGRIIFFRKFGGAAFLRLRDQSGELQVWAQENTFGDWSYLDHLDLGDFVKVSGTMTATVKGELSINPTFIQLITKTYQPLPTKTSFKDVESRYRQRYVDLIANQDVLKIFQARSHLIHAIRCTLRDWEFLEVETPSMQLIAGGASAKPFVTHHNALDQDLFLRIAPELYLKRLVVGGMERVFEIGKNYRNEGMSTRHNPEFTMLEFYGAYFKLDDIITLSQELIQIAAETIYTETKIDSPYRDFGQIWPRVTMRQAVEAACIKAKLPGTIVTEISGESPDIKTWAAQAVRKINWTNYRAAALKTPSDGERLSLAFEFLAEPFLTEDYQDGRGNSLPVYIIEHPIEISPLARKIDGRPELADRFELFIGGMEIANAFQELNDPEDQATRFQAQAKLKAGGDEEAMVYDQDYILALEHGLPPCCGFGMGIDRLVQVLTKSNSIRDVILFPLMKPVI